MVSCLGAAYQKTIAPLHIIAQASDDERHPANTSPALRLNTKCLLLWRQVHLNEHKLASVVR